MVAVGAALDDPDRVVQSYHQAEADLVVGVAVRGDAVPVSFDHPHELLIWLQPLPAQALLPALEESAGAAIGAVAPQPAERLFQTVRRVPALVGRHQFLERLPAVQGAVLAVAKQRIAVALDVTWVLGMGSAAGRESVRKYVKDWVGG